jgi:hypothetical protein
MRMHRQLITLFLLAHSVLSAQERGGFVTTLGRDTVAIERFTRTGSLIEGEVVLVSPRVAYAKYRLEFNAQGAPIQFTIEQRVVNDTAPPMVLRHLFGTDSIRFTRSQGSNVRAVAAPAEVIAYLENLYFWAPYEVQTRLATRTVGDSSAFRMVAAGGPKPYNLYFRRRTTDTLSTKFFYPEYWMNYVVDRDGRLLAVDGSHTTIKILAQRQTTVPFEAFLASASAKEKSAGPVGEMSRYDSVSTVVGNTNISVGYNRPAMRGRTIWGGIVPFDAVWRTGANAATRLRLSAPLEIAGTVVPAGNYTIFSLPTATGAMLIINKQFGQWGTEYHAEQDLVRIPVQFARNSERVELFTIRFAEDGGNPALVVEWSDARWTLPLRKPPG